MKVLEPAPGLKHVCNCWQCKAKIEADENDLVYAVHYPGENGNERKDYFIVCPECGHYNQVPDEKLTTGFKKLAIGKGLKVPPISFL